MVGIGGTGFYELGDDQLAPIWHTKRCCKCGERYDITDNQVDWYNLCQDCEETKNNKD